MRTYRLTLHQHGRLLGHFDTSSPGTLASIQAIANRFPLDEGFAHAFFVAEDEQRILEVSDSRIRVISSEPRFVPV
jgi:hypothetical protein